MLRGVRQSCTFIFVGAPWRSWSWRPGVLREWAVEARGGCTDRAWSERWGQLLLGLGSWDVSACGGVGWGRGRMIECHGLDDRGGR